MKKLGRFIPAALLILAATLPLHAQVDGCVDSPENPTAILAMAGLAAAGLNHLRMRLSNRK